MFFILFLLVAMIFPMSADATYDPLAVPNNKYGIHVADTNDIVDTAPLVNSTGGDWGYVTVVIQDNDRDPGKWQKIFDQMRRLHLIPIVRLATHPVSDFWKKPAENDASLWVQFLNALNWPIENRYIVLFNEPNHAKEWGNTIDPEGYAEIFVAYASAFKEASKDFFILPAGFDFSASTTATTLEAAQFVSRLMQAKPEFLDLLDGWTSHSYPNPAFSGSPGASGRGTIRSYLWELSFIGRELPVFITETGWVDTPAEHIRRAAESVWSDPRIAAVTPFIFNYQSPPFLSFSWKKQGSLEFYPHYYEYQALPKRAGDPKQRHAFTIGTPLFPGALVAGSHYNLEMTVKNDGQAIVGTKEGYALSLSGTAGFEAIFDAVPAFEPGESVAIRAKITTAEKSGEYPITVALTRGNQSFTLEEKIVTIVPPPSLNLSIRLGWRRTGSAGDVTVLIYDGDTLIHKFTGLSTNNRSLIVSGLYDIVPGRTYRIVTLVPFYLPRQTIQPIGPNVTAIPVKRFLPLDVNGDGALTILDGIAVLGSRPHDILSRFFGP